METLSVVQSLLIALWVAAVMSRWLGGGATLTLRFTINDWFSLRYIMGDVANAMIVTAALQLIYMGFSLPVEQCLQSLQLQQRLLYQLLY